MKNHAKNLGILLFLAIITLALLQGAQTQWQKILLWDLVDSDDGMRVLQVRAWLDGQGFYDLVNHRSNPPFGASMHWSRLADLPLALAQLMLRPFMGASSAEFAAVFAVPPILGLAYVMLLGNGAKNLSASAFSPFFAMVLFVFSVSATYNFVPGRVDHHGLQLICFAAFLFGLVQNTKKGGIIAGISLGASLTIGFEILPLQIMAVAWLAVAWGIVGRARSLQVLWFSIAFGFAILMGFFINVAPHSYLTKTNDALSIAQLLPILVGAFGLGIAAQFASKQTALWRFFGLGVVAILVALCALQFDELWKPLYWQTSEILRKNWLLANGEVIPMMERPILDQMAVGTMLLLAMLAVFAQLFSRENKGQNANWWLLAILLTSASSLAFFYQTRFHFQATTIAIMALAAILPKYLSQKTSVAALAILAIAAPFAHTKLKQAAKENIGHNNAQFSFDGVKKCRTTRDFAALASQPKGLLATNIDLGALALLTTPHNVLGTAYHRDFGKEYLYQILISNPSAAEIQIRAHGVDYFAYCASDVDIDAIAKFAPNGLMAQLLARRIPQFLQPIPNQNDSHIVVFKVTQVSLRPKQ